MRAAERSKRDPDSVRLVAVSKTFGVEQVRAAAAAGQADFGENKVQEALPKIAATADLPIRWHLVGHLQSNKARKAAGAFHLIHSLDSIELFEKLDEAAAAARHTIDLLVQVDLAREPTKHGVGERDLQPIFMAARNGTAARVAGLMLLPPVVQNAEDARAYFRELKAVRDRLLDGGTDPSMLRELSMGMSHDFEVAVEEGATMVRLGTAIFGERTYV